MLKRIARDQLRLGMFIHALEGSWFSHPFWKRRFLLTDAADLTAVLDSCIDFLVIDTDKGADLAPPAAAPRASPPAPPPTPALSRRRTDAGWTPSWQQKPAPRQRDDDAAEATKVVNRSKKAMRGIFDGARLGKVIESAVVMAVVDDITASIERNAHAFLKVVRLKSQDEYTYLHSVAVCALMVGLARHLGLDEQAVTELGTAGLLHDIGKIAVPVDVLNKPARLTDAEFALVRTHPERGFLLLSEGEAVPEAALDVCRHHHEKIDGTGYPDRLKGAEISLAARMGAICDVYDALTSNRAYKQAWSPIEAITRMREWHGQFDPDLLFTFMRAIGVFPAGMIVQLRSNRLGLVLDGGRRALRARALAFYSTRDRDYIEPEIVVMRDDLAGDAILAEADPALWAIDPDAIARLLGKHAPELQSVA